MQNFSQINNSLIKHIDSISKVDSLEPPLKNSLKTLVKITSSQILSTNTLYAKRMLFDIPRATYDNLSQMYIKCYLSTGAVASTVESYFATKIFKSISLRTKRGTTLQKITPQYTHMRLDEICTTQLYNQMTAGIEPDQPFVNGEVTVVVPCFFFFSEDDSTFLPTRPLESLELELIVNDSKEAMGMSVNLTSMSFEIFALFHDTNESNKFDDLTYTKKSVPKLLKGTYDVFNEDQVTCATGTTSARLLLRCPYPTFALHLSLVRADSNRRTIKTVKLTTGGNTLIEFDYRMNYVFYGEQRAYIDNGTVSLYFSKLKSRFRDSGLIVFNKEMHPCYIDITFDALDTDYIFYAFEEYRSNFLVSPIGEISIPTSFDLDQLNSSMEKATLSGGQQ